MPEIPADRPALRAAFEALAGRFPSAILGTSDERGELTISIRREDLLAVLGDLRDGQGFNSLTDIIALDLLRERAEGGPRFRVLYQLYRFPEAVRLRLAVDVGEGETLASAVPLYRSADWAEREAYDMFGILFSGHPDLRRVYLPDDFEGHPLRKDFPLEGTGGL